MWRPPAGLRLRMRLSTLLLLTIIVAMGVALAIQQQRERRLRAELQWARDSSTQVILEALEQQVSWPSSPNAPETLESVLKFLKYSSQQTAPRGLYWHGIPIYVDPAGIKEAGARMNSGVPTGAVAQTTLKAILEDALQQSGLDYVVEDGMLRITSKQDAERLRRGAPAR